MKLDQLRHLTRNAEDREKRNTFLDDPDFKVFSQKGLKTVTIVVKMFVSFDHFMIN